MENPKTCECNRCKRYNVYKRWKIKQGDLIKVYSFGHLLKKWGTFLAMDYSFVKWLDEEQNLHFTQLHSLHIQKMV